MTTDINYMDVEEFVEEGYLQEVNRLVLHPAGLALSVEAGWTRNGSDDWVDEVLADVDPLTVTLTDPRAVLWKFIQDQGLDQRHCGRIWDYRHDPEGIVYGEGMIDTQKRERVRAEIVKHREAREELFGPEHDPQRKYPGRVQHFDEGVQSGG